MHLSVEMIRPVTPDAAVEEIELCIDRRALEYLVQQLQHLKYAGDHFHLFSDEWGTGELSLKTFMPNSVPAHHLRVTLVEPSE